MENSGNFISRHKYTLAVVGLAGAAAVGPSIYHAWDEWIHPRSEIVAGVPGQVEKHLTGSRCAALVKAICVRHETTYYLGIEQCPADVQAAKQGEQTTTFNKEVGEIYTNCYYDTIQVSADTWQRHADGSTITFDGPVGEHLQK